MNSKRNNSQNLKHHKWTSWWK